MRVTLRPGLAPSQQLLENPLAIHQFPTLRLIQANLDFPPQLLQRVLATLLSLRHS